MKKMSKFCFVIIESLNRAPYLSKYLNIVNQDYDIIIWDRSANSQNPGANNYYVMHYKEGKELTYKDKLLGYIKFSHFASNILKENDYKGVFVFTANVGILCHKVLINKYKNHYLLDIRDYWQEKHKIIYNIERSLVNNSYANVISSRAYREFLPKADYIITHNSQIIDVALMTNLRKQQVKRKGQIVIACIGAVKYIEYDKKVLDYFANDNRFFLKFIGKGYEQLEEYCKQKGIYNVYIEGMFPMSETFTKYEGIDMILNMYGNHTPKLDYALSNKLYFAAQLGKPIVVCKDTYMEKIVVDNGFGIAVDINFEQSREILFEYYNSIDYKEFINNCDLFLNKVTEDEKMFEKTIKQFINNK